MARVPIVEDQKKLLQSLRRDLEEEGYEVVTATTGEEGYYLATTASPDAIVLDLMLPGRDGLKVLRDLRGQGYARPVLILSARDAIAREVWKEVTGAPTNAIDVYVTLLRKKVERPGARQLIHTVRGVGYALRDGT